MEDSESIDKFSKDYIVERKYVEEYVTHLLQLEWLKQMRVKERKSQAAIKRSKTVEDYDWHSLLSDGRIGKLTILELNKYLEHHKLPITGKKNDKIRTIAAHLSADYLHGHASVHVQGDSVDEDSNDEVNLAEVDSSD